jgi:hypothetical protein
MIRTILPALLLLFTISCSDGDSKSDKPDGSQMQQGNALPFLNTVDPDTLKKVDAVIADIKTKIANNQLTKKTIEGVDQVGGEVYGYFYPDHSIAYVYSSFTAKSARSERISFYKNNSLIFCDFKLYQFETDAKGVENSHKEHFRAEKIFYLPEGNFSKESVTVFNEKIDYPCAPEALFPKSQLPPAKEMVMRTGVIKEHLEKSGE